MATLHGQSTPGLLTSLDHRLPHHAAVDPDHPPQDVAFETDALEHMPYPVRRAEIQIPNYVEWFHAAGDGEQEKNVDQLNRLVDQHVDVDSEDLDFSHDETVQAFVAKFPTDNVPPDALYYRVPLWYVRDNTLHIPCARLVSPKTGRAYWDSAVSPADAIDFMRLLRGRGLAGKVQRSRNLHAHVFSGSVSRQRVWDMYLLQLTQNADITSLSVDELATEFVRVGRQPQYMGSALCARLTTPDRDRQFVVPQDIACLTRAQLRHHLERFPEHIRCLIETTLSTARQNVFRRAHSQEWDQFCHQELKPTTGQ